MLYFATVVLTLLGVSFCQDFKTDYLSMVDDLGFQYDYGLWKPIATVDEGKGCCLPPEMEVMEGMMLAEAGGRREGETDCPGGNCPRAPKVIMGKIKVAMSAKKNMTFSDIYLYTRGKGMHLNVYQDFSKAWPSYDSVRIEGRTLFRCSNSYWVKIMNKQDTLAGECFPVSNRTNTFDIVQLDTVSLFNLSFQRNCLKVHAKRRAERLTIQLVQYKVDMKTGKCEPSRVQYKPFCMPDGSKVLGNVYFGNQEGANHINSTWYQIVDKKTRDEGFVAIMSTGNANECVPVTESVYGSAKGFSYALTIDFMNFVPKVKDMSVFNIPDQCKKDDNLLVPAVNPFGGSMFFN